jgi:hypothetical protein
LYGENDDADRLIALANDMQLLLSGASSNRSVTVLAELIADRQRAISVMQVSRR